MTSQGILYDLITLAIAAAIGAILWLPVVVLSRLGLGNEGMLWYLVAYPIMVLAGFVVARWHPMPPFRFAVIMNAASYVTAWNWIEGTGELMPIEIIIMLILTIPIVLAARWGHRRHASP